MADGDKPAKKPWSAFQKSKIRLMIKETIKWLAKMADHGVDFYFNEEDAIDKQIEVGIDRYLRGKDAGTRADQGSSTSASQPSRSPARPSPAPGPVPDGDRHPSGDRPPAPLQ